MKNKCTNSTEEPKGNLDEHLGVKKEVHENSCQRTAKLQSSWKQNLQIGYGAVAAELVCSPLSQFHLL